MKNHSLLRTNLVKNTKSCNSSCNCDNTCCNYYKSNQIIRSNSKAKYQNKSHFLQSNNSHKLTFSDKGKIQGT